MMNEPLIHLPVYEPAGRDVRLDETDLLQHLLIIGATGCGKTTLLNRILAQVIARPDTGLLIFDAKQDATVARVSALALEHRRNHVILGPQGTHHVDLFCALRTLADVEGMVKRLLAGSQSMGKENEFWTEIRETMLDAALTMLVEERVPVKFEAAVSLMSDWFFRQQPRERVVHIAELIRHRLPGRPPAEQRKLSQTLDTISMWNSMEGRTRSNVQATLVNALRPFAGMGAASCFEPNDRPVFDVGDLATHGGICTVSVNATTDPALAGLLFKLVKQDFLNAVQQRRNNEGCLVGIFADELPLLVTPADVETLATVRSRRCFVCAATQGLAILDEKLGLRQRKALLNNFGTLIFMRGREEETDMCAAVHLGISIQWVKGTRTRDDGYLLSREPRKVPRHSLVCPPGALGRLQPHQGFVTVPHQERFELPLWFVPQYEETPSTPLFLPPQSVDPATSERLHRQLQDCGFKRRLDEPQLLAAVKLFDDRKGLQPALAAATEFFHQRAILVPDGLHTLPVPWLKALPGILWSMRQPHWSHLPYMIRELFLTDGLLQFRFMQEPLRDPDDHHVGAFDQLRQAVNTRLYPSCYRPLHRRHIHRLKLTTPELEP